MKNVHKAGLPVAIMILVLTGCNNPKQEKTPMTLITQISPSAWQALEKKRVVFGHQSVGDNILNGIKQLAARDSVSINISQQRTAPFQPGISHFYIGNNTDPTSKIQDFAAAIDESAAQGADVALMKLCYIDFNADTDAKQLANDYITSLESLAKKYPHTRFVAVTAPLTAVQTGPKAWVKRLLGKPLNGAVDNAKRGEFNTLLRQQYLAEGRLFDLAKAETEASGQAACMTQVDGRQVEVLCPEITNDGGHLNDHGQVLLGAELVNFIGSLSAKQVMK
jgi:hypothetical protein